MHFNNVRELLVLKNINVDTANVKIRISNLQGANFKLIDCNNVQW